MTQSSFLQDGAAGKTGADGKAGPAGKDGAPGKDAAPGKDGAAGPAGKVRPTQDDACCICAITCPAVCCGDDMHSSLMTTSLCLACC